MMESTKPELSLIVTVVDGGKTLERCLDALAHQENAPRLEVIIPYDDAIPEVGALASRYPGFIFLDLGSLGAKKPSNAFDEHMLYDRRRSAGLLIAKADLVAIIEDRGWPVPSWARSMVDVHRRFDDAVIGGQIDSAAEGIARWAVFFLDFGRYQAPFETPNPEYVSDTNICYKRAALDKVQHLWRDVYHESEVNWALRDLQAGLRLDAGPKTVQQRGAVGPIAMAMERVHWGRNFAQVRAHGVAPLGRLKWIASTPILPTFLYLRHLRRQMKLGRHLREFALATPAMFCLLGFWSLGELIGYVEAKQSSDSATVSG